MVNWDKTTGTITGCRTRFTNSRASLSRMLRAASILLLPARVLAQVIHGAGVSLGVWASEIAKTASALRASTPSRARVSSKWRQASRIHWRFLTTANCTRGAAVNLARTVTGIMAMCLRRARCSCQKTVLLSIWTVGAITAQCSLSRARRGVGVRGRATRWATARKTTRRFLFASTRSANLLLCRCRAEVIAQRQWRGAATFTCGVAARQFPTLSDLQISPTILANCT
mmetsp:Transcript_78514/g.127388  ORF Transcript_78514/g.127388 Transcript_78514/m.127388 type:complete len:228 (+) Transcript_78514:1456-2139(+)